MGIGGGIDALEVTVQHHLFLTFRGKGTMPVISHRRSRFLILSLPNKHKFLSNTLILLGFCEYFLQFYPLLILYLSSTKPLLNLYSFSTNRLLQKHVLCCNKRSLLRNKGSLFCNKTSLGALLIPNVGILYSQRGNILFPTWEYHALNMGISCFLIPITGCLFTQGRIVVLKTSRGLVEDK